MLMRDKLLSSSHSHLANNWGYTSSILNNKTSHKIQSQDQSKKIKHIHTVFLLRLNYILHNFRGTQG